MHQDVRLPPTSFEHCLSSMEKRSAISSTHIYVPDKISVVADHEIPQIKKLLPAEVKQLEDVKSKVMAPSQCFDVDSLFHIKQATLHQTRQTYWQPIAISAVCVIVIFGILYLSLKSFIHNIAIRCFSSHTVPESTTAEQNPSSSPPPEPRRRAYAQNKDDTQSDVAFTDYSLQSTIKLH
jgi:hypothetical protein